MKTIAVVLQIIAQINLVPADASPITVSPAARVTATQMMALIALHEVI